MKINTHGFEKEENEHDVIDKGDNYVRWGITPRTVQSEWVKKLKNKAGEEWKSRCTEHYAWKAAEYIEFLENKVQQQLLNSDAFIGTNTLSDNTFQERYHEYLLRKTKEQKNIFD